MSELLEFPCDFPIKIMGPTTAEFEGIVLEIVRRHAPDLGEAAVTSRASSGGRYTSITVNLRAKSKEQLDALYRELSGHPAIRVVM
jgi:hypothetical protein